MHADRRQRGQPWLPWWSPVIRSPGPLNSLQRRGRGSSRTGTPTGEEGKSTRGRALGPAEMRTRAVRAEATFKSCCPVELVEHRASVGCPDTAIVACRQPRHAHRVTSCVNVCTTGERRMRGSVYRDGGDDRPQFDVRRVPDRDVRVDLAEVRSSGRHTQASRATTPRVERQRCGHTFSSDGTFLLGAARSRWRRVQMPQGRSRLSRSSWRGRHRLRPPGR